MTILNTTQERIIENREKIDDIIDVIHNVSHELVSVSTTLGSITLGDKWPMDNIFNISCNCPK
jgi:hypothetical protein